MLLQNEDGQIQETHSVSAGLDYPGVGPEHALLAAVGRVRYETAGDAEALEGVRELSECEGILPALESAHAIAGAKRWAQQHPGRTVLVCLSGRGDKDMATLQQALLAAGTHESARAHHAGHPQQRRARPSRRSSPTSPPASRSASASASTCARSPPAPT